MGIKNISDKIRVSKDRIFYNINMRDIDYIRAYNSETQILPKVKHSGVTIHLLQWKKSLISVSFLKYQGLML